MDHKNTSYNFWYSAYHMFLGGTWLFWQCQRCLVLSVLFISFCSAVLSSAYSIYLFNYEFCRIHKSLTQQITKRQKAAAYPVYYLIDNDTCLRYTYNRVRVGINFYVKGY